MQNRISSSVCLAALVMTLGGCGLFPELRHVMGPPKIDPTPITKKAALEVFTSHSSGFNNSNGPFHVGPEDFKVDHTGVHIVQVDKIPRGGGADVRFYEVGQPKRRDIYFTEVTLIQFTIDPKVINGEWARWGNIRIISPNETNFIHGPWLHATTAVGSAGRYYNWGLKEAVRLLCPNAKIED